MRTLTIFIFSLLFFCVAAQEGIKFENLSFNEALTKAKEDKKAVFIDCFTEWCGPCKTMDKEVFPQLETGKYFAPRFVSVKFDMEKGEGVELAKKFGVTKFPTFLIISPNGEELHRVVGSSKTEDFIKKIDRGLDKTTALTNLDQLYKSGKLENKHYVNYQIALSNASRKDEADKLLTELWGKLSDEEKSQPEYWWIYDNPKIATLQSPYFQFLENNLSAFKKQGEEKISKYMYEKYLPVIDSYVYGYASEQEGFECAEIDRLMEKINTWNISDGNVMWNMCRLGKARCEGNTSKAVTIMEELQPQLSPDKYSRLLGPLELISKKGTKDELIAAIKVLEKARATATGKGKELLTSYISTYRKLSVTGISFENMSFNEVLEIAKKENKLIFMDAYTSWCGPCKQMAQTVFTNEKVGDFFNKNFINVKIDMEKGEGPDLAKKYGVTAYPTYLLIRPDGILQYSAYGFMEPDKFIKTISEGLDTKNSINVQKMKYEAGNRTKEFLTLYSILLFKSGHPEAYKVSKDLLQYLNKREKFSPEYWYIYDNVLAVKDFEKEYEFVLKNIDKYYENIGHERVDSTLSMMYRLKALYSINHEQYRLTNEKIALMEKEITELDFSDKHMLLAFMRLAKVALTKNKDLFLKAAEEESSGRLSAETFPYMDLTEFALQEANKGQRERWKNIGQKLLLQMEQSFKKSQLQGFISNVFAEK
ncbi:MAG: thioredoxin domain-containing protein [Bacteroidia bacterium]|nr:thioredoxin domain-containing protein [Bacteroidia bacterium]